MVTLLHRRYLIVQRVGGNENSFEICHTQWIIADNGDSKQNMPMGQGGQLEMFK